MFAGGIWGLLVAAGDPPGRWWCTCVSFLVELVVGATTCFPMIDTNLQIMCWNVQGLNSPARRAVFCEAAEMHKLALLCLQETKINEWNRSLVREVGGCRLADCVVLPVTGTRGGVAIFWDKSRVGVQSQAIGQFSITAKITLAAAASSFWMTTVSGPSPTGGMMSSWPS